MGIPFIYGKIAVDENFTNRESERTRLQNNVLAKVNTILISQRRWGKSSLVSYVANEMQQKNKKTLFCFIDLFNIRTEEEFYHLLAKELIKVSSGKIEEQIINVRKFFKHLIPKITIGIDPIQDFSMEFNWEEIKQNPDEVLNLAERISIEKGVQIIVCIDEFQNINLFSDSMAFQRKLRSNLQYHQHATYIFYGSKKHMMIELFENQSNPFYKFGDLIFLNKIESIYWIDYITKSFKGTGKSISNEIAAEIAARMENHPYFVQQLSQITWFLTKKTCSDKILDEAIDQMILQNSILYHKELDNLNNTQLNFLKALIDNVNQLSSQETIIKYRLGTSANVSKIKSALLNKELIDITSGKIFFIDPVFKLFLRKYLK